MNYTDLNLVGSDVLNLITTGMYTNPLSVYREYVQNATDSLASSVDSKEGKVEIKVIPSESRVVIRDNGLGLSYEQAKRDLIPVARSRKSTLEHRGFRGIGRLSGLVFGSTVTFLTRRTKTEPVTKIAWDGHKLRSGIQQRLSIDEVIPAAVTLETLESDNYPASFFEVGISGVSRYAATSILNLDLVRSYIGEVCPVPFDERFPYASVVDSLIGRHQRQPKMHIYLNEEKVSIKKLHAPRIRFSERREEDYLEFEEISIPSISNGELAAVGWIVHWPYHGAIPKELGVRGIRARVGNIQIGDERIFDHLFSESRFNRWCVAELHILDPNIVPNGRRDYFEPNPHLRNLENYVGAVCRKVERTCRFESRKRNGRKRLSLLLEELNSTYDLAVSGYLTEDAANDMIVEAKSKITTLGNQFRSKNFDIDLQQLDELESKLEKFSTICRNGKFDSFNQSVEGIYKDIFSALARISPSHESAHRTIEAIFSEVSRK